MAPVLVVIMLSKPKTTFSYLHNRWAKLSEIL